MAAVKTVENEASGKGAAEGKGEQAIAKTEDDADSVWEEERSRWHTS